MEKRESKHRGRPPRSESRLCKKPWLIFTGGTYEKGSYGHSIQLATCRLWRSCCTSSNANTNTGEWHMQSRALLTGGHNTSTRNAYCYSNATSCHAWETT